MKIKEVKADLFSAPDDYYLAHCISADFGMGKGIVVEFNNRFNMRNKLLKKYPLNDWDNKGYCLRCGRVFNLVTKEFYYNKPTYKTLENALCDMRDCVTKYGISKIAMPKIGCGLDRLLWGKVRKIIENVFEDVDVEILVCYL